MALATTTKFGNFIFRLSDGGSPETFGAPCGLTTKSLTFSKETQDVDIPDCDDPDEIAWVGRDAARLSASVSGEGVLAAESVEAWDDFFRNGDSIRCQVEIIFPAKTILYEGFFHLTTLTTGAERGGRATISIEAISDGEIERTVTP